MDRGLKDSSECFVCPEGRVCGEFGISNISLSTACSSGYVCDEGTG
jgi:hypothetical protein